MPGESVKSEARERGGGLACRDGLPHLARRENFRKGWAPIEIEMNSPRGKAPSPSIRSGENFRMGWAPKFSKKKRAPSTAEVV